MKKKSEPFNRVIFFTDKEIITFHNVTDVQKAIRYLQNRWHKIVHHANEYNERRQFVKQHKPL